MVNGLDSEYVLRLIETKRYVLRLVYNENLSSELTRFQIEKNKFLKIEKDKDCITFKFINYFGYSRVNLIHGNCKYQIVFEAIKRNPDCLLSANEEFRLIGLVVPSKKLFTNLFSYSKGCKVLRETTEIMVLYHK